MKKIKYEKLAANMLRDLTNQHDASSSRKIFEVCGPISTGGMGSIRLNIDKMSLVDGDIMIGISCINVMIPCSHPTLFQALFSYLTMKAQQEKNGNMIWL